MAHGSVGYFESIQACCIAHSRRRNVEVGANFLAECRHIFDTLRETYEHPMHDALARQRQLSPGYCLHLDKADNEPEDAVKVLDLLGRL